MAAFRQFGFGMVLMLNYPIFSTLQTLVGSPTSSFASDLFLAGLISVALSLGEQDKEEAKS